MRVKLFVICRYKEDKHTIIFFCIIIYYSIKKNRGVWLLYYPYPYIKVSIFPLTEVFIYKFVQCIYKRVQLDISKKIWKRKNEQ